ncbi:MAG: 50S ribosomal protein L11 methyltransferase, partial [Pseudomonadales bacterium]|nr:50S ribosomal protein L11 methyltransferase [Pseudomonadales bacterium]
DYGCGSGILAIAALLLGAEQAVAIDIDPQALLATRENAERNQISTERLTTFTTEDEPAVVADLLLANILAGPLITLAPHLSQRLAPGGTLVLSGLLAEQVEAVAAAYRPWFDLAAPTFAQEWVLLSGIKKADPT